MTFLCSHFYQIWINKKCICWQWLQRQSLYLLLWQDLVSHRCSWEHLAQLLKRIHFSLLIFCLLCITKEHIIKWWCLAFYWIILCNMIVQMHCSKISIYVISLRLLLMEVVLKYIQEILPKPKKKEKNKDRIIQIQQLNQFHLKRTS